MRTLIRSLALLAALLPAIAAAQVPNTPQTLPANTVVGRLGVTPGPAQAIPFSRFQSAVSGPCATASAGLVPATGGGTSNFLRADCTFANPLPAQTTAAANQIPVFPGSNGAAVATSATTWFDQAYCSTVGYLVVRLVGAWTCSNAVPRNVVWFGADPTGIVASDTPVSNAYTSLGTFGGRLYFPAGKYQLAAQFAKTLPNAQYGVSIVGDGQGSTILLWPNAAGGLQFTETNQKNSIQIRDLSIMTSQAGGGAGLKIIGIGGGNTNPSDITNVTFSGDDLNGVALSTHYWSQGIWLHAVSQLDGYNVNTWGPFNPTPGGASAGTGLLIEGEPTGTLYSTLINFTASTFNAHNVGVTLGSYWQGVTFTACNWNGALGVAGLQVNGGALGTLALLSINNSQFNYAGTQISLATGVNSVFVINSTITGATTNGIGINAGASNAVSIIGNYFNLMGAPTGTYAAALNGPVGVIIGNMLNGVANGFNLQASSSNVTVGLNAYTGVTTKIINSGTGNSVGTAVAGAMAGVVP